MNQRGLDTPEATERSGRRVGAALHADWPPQPVLVTLTGELGSGKTTWVRGLLRGLGWRGSVRSPTYTLVEPYDVAAGRVYHIDLYRVGDGGELEVLGIREILAEPALCLVEWPERAADLLAVADLEISLGHSGSGRSLTIRAGSAVGERLMAGDSCGPRASG